jgi:molybdenum-dependent DNA-binding transcriptional regulator ModE
MVVYTEDFKTMKNITLSADEKLIEAARERARAEHTTLNEEFRRWLKAYARREQQAAEALAVMRELQGKLRVGRKLTRDEMNER